MAPVFPVELFDEKIFCARLRLVCGSTARGILSEDVFHFVEERRAASAGVFSTFSVAPSAVIRRTYVSFIPVRRAR